MRAGEERSGEKEEKLRRIKCEIFPPSSSRGEKGEAKENRDKPDTPAKVNPKEIFVRKVRNPKRLAGEGGAEGIVGVTAAASLPVLGLLQ